MNPFMEHWWNDTERAIQTYSKKKLTPSYFVQSMDWTGVQPGPPAQTARALPEPMS